MPKFIEGGYSAATRWYVKGFNADFDGDQMAVHLATSDVA